MTATPADIPSDMTLEIGESLSPDDFIALTRAFFGYVKEVAATVTPEGERIDWTVRVKEGSSLIAVDPSPSVPQAVLHNVYAKSANGLRFLERGNVEASGLPDTALRHLRTLSEMTAPTRTRRRELRLWIERKPIAFDDSIAQAISEDWRAAYTDFGVIEGKLDTIQDRGALQFQVRDAMLHQTVKCSFPEEMLALAFENFRKRVEVSGLVYYRRNGTPLSIAVTQLEAFPDDSELPTAHDVRGILSTA